MALIYNGTTIPNNATITYNGTALTKIIFNGVEVWKKITKEYKTGDLFYMTSNTTPAPFVVTAEVNGAYEGDDTSQAYKTFRNSYFVKKGTVAGQYVGSRLTFNLTKKIYPVTILWKGVNEAGGGAGGGGKSQLWLRNASGSWYVADEDTDPGPQRTYTMNGNTIITGVGVRTIYGSGDWKYLTVGPCRITAWYEEE